MQTLLVRVQVLNTTLELSRSSSELESDGAVVDLLPHFRQGSNANVLARVLQTVVQVRNELVDRTLVNNSTGDTLSDKDLVGLGEVTGGGGVALLVGLLHGVDGTHTTVSLQTLTVLEEVLTWRLSGTCEHTAHHHTGGTQGQSLDNVTDVTDTTVSHTWDAKLVGELGDVVDGGTLRSTTGHDFLGDTDGTGTHTDSQTVATGLDQRSGLLSGDDVTGDDL